MIRNHYFTAEESIRLMREKMIEDLVAKGWDAKGILIRPVDPFQDGINGYQAEQGTIEAQLLWALANEADH